MTERLGPGKGSELSIVRASLQDLDAIKRLDNAVFPEGNADLEPASESELNHGVVNGDIFVAVSEGWIVGFIHFEKLGPIVNLVSLAVDPQHQGQGFGQALMEHMSDLLSPSVEEVSCVTSPRNAPMVSLLLKSGFVGTSLVEGYFGTGKDRLVFKKGKRLEERLVGSSSLVPLESSTALRVLMSNGDKQISGIHHGAQGALLEITHIAEIDLSDARNNEASTSVSQAGGILAALTFLLGFSFALDSFSVFLRAFLVLAVVTTVGAVQVYANATGNILRGKDSGFDRHMKMGNLLLDFGGHYPLIIVVPAIFVSFDDPLFLQIAVAGAVSLLLILYELSTYSIFARYKQGMLNLVLMVLTALLPLISVWSQYSFASQLEWILIALTVLFLRFFLHASRSQVEGESLTKP